MEIILKVIGSILLGLAIQGVVALFDHHIVWWLAQVIAWMVVWGGFFFISDDVDFGDLFD